MIYNTRKLWREQHLPVSNWHVKVLLILVMTCAFLSHDGFSTSVNYYNPSLSTTPNPNDIHCSSTSATSSSHPMIFSSIFVRAYERDQSEQRARFVLDSRNRRRQFFEATIKQHYSPADSNNNTNASSTSNNDTNHDTNHDTNSEKKTIQDYFMQQSDGAIRAGLPLNQTTNMQTLQAFIPGSFPPMPPSRISANIQKVKSMFQHAYDSYMYHAYPGSELKPLTCKSGLFDLVRLPALTLIDSLDMLLLMKNHTEFARSVERLRVLDLEYQTHDYIKFDNRVLRGGLFAQNQNVSVFEANIRVLGGLLSAHQMAEVWMEKKVVVEDVFGDDGSVLIGEIVGDKDICVNGIHKGLRGHDAVCSNGKDVKVCQSGIPNVDADTKLKKKRGKIHVEPKEAEQYATHTQASNMTNAEDFWVYDGFLLELAQDIGKRLLPAFDTKTGIPYGTVNLIYGVPEGETKIASLAGGGTLTLEMELLSRLTEDKAYGKLARLATRALFSRRSDIDLLGKHIDVQDGQWTETMSGIGSNSDSVYEYLIKHHVLFQEDEDFFAMFNITYSGIQQNGKLGDWYPDVPMKDGLAQPSSAFESLAAFYPGMQILLGELNPAARSTDAFTLARESVRFLPERFDFTQFEAYYNHQTYPLRPELYESNYFLHVATKDLSLSSTSGWLWNADFFMNELDSVAKTDCGYATVTGISSKTEKNKLSLGDEMPSYFISETLKYLYLTFDSDNPIDTDKERNWIFTTEAHPIHTVPPVDNMSQSNEPWLDSARKDLFVTLDRLIASKAPPSDAVPIKSKPSLHAKYLQKERWATYTGKFPHMKDLKKIDMSTARGAGTQSGMEDSSGRFMHRPPNGIEIEPESVDSLNFAYLNYAKNGRGARIEKSCPNYHQSNALWIQALVGEETDYSQAFESTMSNDFAVNTLKPQLPSAITASALFGTSYLNKDPKTCKSKSNRASANYDDPLRQGIWRRGTQRIDMGDSGAFDVFVDPSGAGYFVKHVQSGESIEVTIVQAEPGVDGIGQQFIAVDSYVMADAGIKEKSSLLNQFKSALTFKPAHKRKKKRRVLIADMDGNSFECKVILKSAIGKLHGEHDMNLMKEIGGFPCLPASYGPTSMSALTSKGSEGVSYEAKLYRKDQSDPFGCHEDWDNDQTCIESTDFEVNIRRLAEAYEQLAVLKKDSISSKKDMDAIENVISNLEKQIELDEETCFAEAPRVQLVLRGKCNFRSKGFNLQNRFNAEALIVVNSDPRGLFIMAGPLTKSQQMSNADDPASVLVTGEDGEHIERIIDQYSKEGQEIFAKVEITPSSGSVTDSSKSNTAKLAQSNRVRWPIVSTALNSIQIYASQGWGVGAVKENNFWQIMLLQHNYE